jgi:hypothetical protein
MKDLAKYCGIHWVCIPTMTHFKNDGCIDEGRAKQKEMTKEEAASKQESRKPDQNRRTKTKKELKRQRRVQKSPIPTHPLHIGTS